MTPRTTRTAPPSDAVRLGAGTLCLAFAALLATTPATALAETRDTRTLEESFAPSGAPFGKLIVDNVFGSVVVRGHDRDTVEMVATETVIADDRDAARRAREEVRLETRTVDGAVELFVDGPFRDSRDRDRWRDHRDPGYRVHYDLEIRAPRHLALDLRTVNDGEIDVEGVEGAFRLRNVNGGLRLIGTAGTGSLHTVNGDIVAEFTAAPREDLEAHTINGDIRLSFPADLAADVRFESLNGELRIASPDRGGWPVAAMAPELRVDERADRPRYRVDRVATWRIGPGGPVLELETLNGDAILTGAD